MSIKRLLGLIAAAFLAISVLGCDAIQRYHKGDRVYIDHSYMGGQADGSIARTYWPEDGWVGVIDRVDDYGKYGDRNIFSPYLWGYGFKPEARFINADSNKYTFQHRLGTMNTEGWNPYGWQSEIHPYNEKAAVDLRAKARAAEMGWLAGEGLTVDDLCAKYRLVK